MKRLKYILVALAAIGLAVGYAYRVDIRDAFSAWTAPKLPTAARYQPPSSQGGLISDQPSPVEGGVATSQNYVLISSPTTFPRKVDPLADNGPLPNETNLDVPFTTQAPLGDWSYPYQETCEEASAIMVDGFYRGASGVIAPQKAKVAIDKLVAYEEKTLGFYKDTNADQTAQLIKSYFGYKEVLVVPLKSAQDIKRVVANGYPVIVPAYGKMLKNPNFRNGGPLYHMLVVKGYTGSRFITNDPGTRKGADYTYAYDTLFNAAHDWNDGKVETGAKYMIIVVPNPK